MMLETPIHLADVLGRLKVGIYQGWQHSVMAMHGWGHTELDYWRDLLVIIKIYDMLLLFGCIAAQLRSYWRVLHEKDLLGKEIMGDILRLIIKNFVVVKVNFGRDIQGWVGRIFDVWWSHSVNFRWFHATSIVHLWCVTNSQLEEWKDGKKSKS